jgi:rubrerythrin
MNRTGIMTAREQAQAMVDATAEFLPSSDGTAMAIAAVRVAYADEGETFGEAPPPSSLTGKAKSAINAMTGGPGALLLDKLAERLAFEHSGARLYEALVSKHQAYGSFDGGPSEQDLLHVLQEEYEHADLLQNAIKELDGDPTALTPSANLAAVVSKGLPQVLSDPRTNLLQSLEAILVAELSDNECWSTLAVLAREAGREELERMCGEAIRHEREHLMNVRRWIAAGHGHAMTDGAPLPEDAADEEFTFSEGSRADREGFVVSEEEQQQEGRAPTKSRRSKPKASDR